LRYERVQKRVFYDVDYNVLYSNWHVRPDEDQRTPLQEFPDVSCYPLAVAPKDREYRAYRDKRKLDNSVLSSLYERNQSAYNANRQFKTMFGNWCWCVLNNSTGKQALKIGSIWHSVQLKASSDSFEAFVPEEIRSSTSEGVFTAPQLLSNICP
jgi:hypothetical protein